MTPLAHRILKELTLPKSQRTFDDDCMLTNDLSSAHCFEMSEVLDLGWELADTFWSHYESHRALKSNILAFLPAPKTWLEWRAIKKDGTKHRLGCLLDSEFCGGGYIDGDVVIVRWANSSPFYSSRLDPTRGMGGGILLINDGVNKANLFKTQIMNGSDPLGQRSFMFLLYAFLAMINSPRIIGRRQHMPHAGLERALRKSQNMVGKFPLRAWTEIKLEVRPPIIDGEAHEAHLTGRRALHFCRAHLRIRMGMLERVSAHWRGDPSLGIKRSRYKLVPQRPDA